MEAVVVYESVFGNTHLIADAVATGIGELIDAEVLTPEEADRDRLAAADLVVIGGPTHMHGMARTSSKEQGVRGERDKAAKGEPAHDIDEHALGETLRDWFGTVGLRGSAAAAFDTRIDASPTLTGRASKGIARRLRHHGWTLVAEPESFVVTKDNDLVDGEEDRARAWGRSLADALVENGPTA